MSKQKGPDAVVLRRHAEDQFAEELAALAKADDRQRPPQLEALALGAVADLPAGRDARGRLRSRPSTSATAG